jgi:hypothetical protein
MTQTSHQRSIPDHPSGSSWCKKCENFLSLDRFPGRKRQHECRLHRKPKIMIERQKMFKDPSRLGLWRMWHYIYLDSKTVFGHEKLGIFQEHIKKNCLKNSIKPSVESRILPTDPRSPITEDNISLVDRIGRMVLTNTWKLTKHTETYQTVLKQQVCHSSPVKGTSPQET